MGPVFPLGYHHTCCQRVLGVRGRMCSETNQSLVDLVVRRFCKPCWFRVPWVRPLRWKRGLPFQPRECFFFFFFFRAVFYHALDLFDSVDGPKLFRVFIPCCAGSLGASHRPHSCRCGPPPPPLPPPLQPSLSALRIGRRPAEARTGSGSTPAKPELSCGAKASLPEGIKLGSAGRDYRGRVCCFAAAVRSTSAGWGSIGRAQTSVRDGVRVGG